MTTHARDMQIARYMMDAARIGGTSLAADFVRLAKLDITEKGPSDFVSTADLESERLIMAFLSEKLPGMAVLGEESGGEPLTGPEPCIVIDPLDGTNNFLHGIPHFAVSLALIANGEVRAGVTFNPLNGDMFWAVKGQGAFLGEQRLSGSTRETLPKAVVGTCFPYHGKGDPAKCAREMLALMPQISGVRSPGSAALELAFVAEGRFDGFWSHGAKLDLWDIAAGIVIAGEAGCLVTEIDGQGDPMSCRNILAAPPQYHGRFVDILAQAAG